MRLYKGAKPISGNASLCSYPRNLKECRRGRYVWVQARGGGSNQINWHACLLFRDCALLRPVCERLAGWTQIGAG